MHDDSWREAATKQVRVLQIIVGALVAGVVFFLMIVLSICPPANLAPGMLTAVAVIFAGAMLITYPVVLRIPVATALRRILAGTFRIVDSWKCGSLADDLASDRGIGLSDVQGLLSLFQRKTILGAAMIELRVFRGDCLFHRRRFRQSWFGRGVVGRAGPHFPTLSRVTGWVDRQIELLEQERTLGGRR